MKNNSKPNYSVFRLSHTLVRTATQEEEKRKRQVRHIKRRFLLENRHLLKCGGFSDENGPVRPALPSLPMMIEKILFSN
jgi:hypothetical protein